PRWWQEACDLPGGDPPRPRHPIFIVPSAPPLRVAAIDLGSNAIRFVAAERVRHGELAELAYDRAAVRMGHDAFRTGRLTEAAMDAALAALSGFRRRMDALGVARYRAVATSAV